MPDGYNGPTIGSPISSQTLATIANANNQLVGLKALRSVPMGVTHPLKTWDKDDEVTFGDFFDPLVREAFWDEADDTQGHIPDNNRMDADWLSSMSRIVFPMEMNPHTTDVGVNLLIRTSPRPGLTNTITVTLSTEPDLLTDPSSPLPDEVDRITRNFRNNSNALPAPVGQYFPPQWVSTGLTPQDSTVNWRPMQVPPLTPIASQLLWVRVDTTRYVEILHMDVFECYKRSI
jgi:hypothetical protein